MIILTPSHAAPFKWTDPHSWPFVVWIWLAMIVASFAASAWKWFQKKQAESWPVTDAKIGSAVAKQPDATFFRPKNRNLPWAGVLDYSYSAEGGYQTGSYQRLFATEAEALQFVRDLEGMTVAVHYNPDAPAKSLVADADVETLLASRQPPTEEEVAQIERAEAVNALPEWQKRLIWPFVLLAGAGLAVSIAVHIGALFGQQVLPQQYFFLLHVGIFVVFIPAILVSQKAGNTGTGGITKKQMFKGAPAWMNYGLTGLFCYAFVNFFIFMAQMPAKHSGPTPPTLEWRGFSGHWMVFYAASFVMLYAATQAGTRRCVNGHAMAADVDYCPQCGAPVAGSFDR